MSRSFEVKPLSSPRLKSFYKARGVSYVKERLRAATRPLCALVSLAIFRALSLLSINGINEIIRKRSDVLNISRSKVIFFSSRNRVTERRRKIVPDPVVARFKSTLRRNIFYELYKSPKPEEKREKKLRNGHSPRNFYGLSWPVLWVTFKAVHDSCWIFFVLRPCLTFQERGNKSRP